MDQQSNRNGTPVSVRFTTMGRGARQALAAGMVVLGATLGATAFAQHGGPGMGGPGAMGMGGPGMFMGRPEHINRMVDRWLDSVNATDAQRTQIKQIALAAATDLQAQREAGRALRDESLQVFTAPTVDARAAEALRQRTLAQHDQTSRRITQAMVDVANVLTPQQRAQMAERIKQRQQRMQERMRDRANTAPAS